MILILKLIAKRTKLILALSLMCLPLWLSSAQGQNPSPSPSPCCSPGPDQSCCDGTPYNKNETDTSVDLDITAILDAVNTAGKAFQITGDGCTFAGDASLSIKVEGKKYDECCPKDGGGNYVHHAEDLSIQIQADIASMTCKFNFLSTVDIPAWLAFAGLEMDGKISSSATPIKISNSCQGNSQLCVDITGISVSLSVKGKASVGPTYSSQYTLASAEVGGTGSENLAGQICIDKDKGTLSLKDVKATPSIDVEVKYTAGSVSSSFKLPLLNGSN